MCREKRGMNCGWMCGFLSRLDPGSVDDDRLDLAIVAELTPETRTEFSHVRSARCVVVPEKKECSHEKSGPGALARMRLRPVNLISPGPAKPVLARRAADGNLPICQPRALARPTPDVTTTLA